MLPRNGPDRIQTAFDDHRLVANAGDKMMTLVASALGGQGAVHVGNLPVQFPVGPRAPVGSCEPGGDGPIAQGRANTTRGAAHFLRETVSRVRHAEVENAIRDLKHGVGLNHLPSGRFPANAAWLAAQVMDHNLARWTGHIGLAERVCTTKTLRRRFFSLVGRHPASSLGLALEKAFQLRLGATACPAAPILAAPTVRPVEIKVSPALPLTFHHASPDQPCRIPSVDLG